MPVLAVYFCPSSVRVVATFSGTVLFPLLCSVLPFSPLIHWLFSLSNFVIPSKCLKNFVCEKCYVFVSNSSIQYQIVNNVSTYGILTRKKSLNIRLFLCLLFSPVGVSITRLQQQSADILGQHFPLYLFPVWDISWWNTLPCSSEEVPMFPGKKFKWECKKWSFNDILHPIALCDEISCCCCTVLL